VLAVNWIAGVVRCLDTDAGDFHGWISLAGFGIFLVLQIFIKNRMTNTSKDKITV